MTQCQSSDLQHFNKTITLLKNFRSGWNCVNRLKWLSVNHQTFNTLTRQLHFRETFEVDEIVLTDTNIKVAFNMNHNDDLFHTDLILYKIDYKIRKWKYKINAADDIEHINLMRNFHDWSSGDSLFPCYKLKSHIW